MSYRTPAEVLAVATQVLAVAAPELTPPPPVRRTGVEPRMIAVRDGHGAPPGRHRQRPGPPGGPGGRRGGGRGHAGPGGHPRPRVDALGAVRGAGRRRPAGGGRPGHAQGRTVRAAGAAGRRRAPTASSSTRWSWSSRGHRRRDGPGPAHAVRGAHPAHPAAQCGPPDPPPAALRRRRPARLRARPGRAACPIPGSSGARLRHRSRAARAARWARRPLDPGRPSARVGPRTGPSSTKNTA